jgi:hypothetical protein
VAVELIGLRDILHSAYIGMVKFMGLDDEEAAELPEGLLEDAVVPVIGYKAEELREYREELMRVRRGYEVLFLGLGAAVVVLALVK